MRDWGYKVAMCCYLDGLSCFHINLNLSPLEYILFRPASTILCNSCHSLQHPEHPIHHLIYSNYHHKLHNVRRNQPTSPRRHNRYSQIPRRIHTPRPLPSLPSRFNIYYTSDISILFASHIGSRQLSDCDIVSTLPLPCPFLF